MNEGAVYVRATLPNSVNLEESVRLTKEMKAKLQSFEEVDFILTQTGRPNDGTDATGFFNIEFHAELKPESEWKRKMSKEKLIEQMQDSLAVYPGIIFAFSQPIQDNVEEYVAGVKSALVIKIFGNDLYTLEAAADSVAGVIKAVRGLDGGSGRVGLFLRIAEMRPSGYRQERNPFAVGTFSECEPASREQIP